MIDKEGKWPEEIGGSYGSRNTQQMLWAPELHRSCLGENPHKTRDRGDGRGGGHGYLGILGGAWV